jgi:hypothetical protein
MSGGFGPPKPDGFMLPYRSSNVKSYYYSLIGTNVTVSSGNGKAAIPLDLRRNTAKPERSVTPSGWYAFRSAVIV